MMLGRMAAVGGLLILSGCAKVPECTDEAALAQLPAILDKGIRADILEYWSEVAAPSVAPIFLEHYAPTGIRIRDIRPVAIEKEVRKVRCQAVAEFSWTDPGDIDPISEQLGTAVAKSTDILSVLRRSDQVSQAMANMHLLVMQLAQKGSSAPFDYSIQVVEENQYVTVEIEPALRAVFAQP